MSLRVVILVGATLLCGHDVLAQSCATAINEFRDIVKTETRMGHVSDNSQSSALAELARIDGLCRAGRNADAMAALQALQRRMKFR